MSFFSVSFGNVFQLIRLTVQRVSCLLTFQNTRMRSSRTRWSQLRPSSPHLSLRLLQIGPWIKDQVNMFSLFPNTFAKLGEVKEAGILTLHACVCAKLLQSCPTLRLHGLYSPPGSSVHGGSPDKNPGVGCHALLQGILPNESGC